MGSRLIGFPLLLCAAACTSVNTAPTRTILVPQNGPSAHVYASYFGGLTSRSVRTTFRTDRHAHVIVGRLGGDGRVEILYPENPRATTLVRGGKTYSARSFATNYDGIPQMYSYASRAPRSSAALTDSYDGRGNGFIFIIATQVPMFTEILDNHGAWSDSLEVEDYHSSFDPRYAIRNLAEELTRGLPYTLDYASSFMSSAYTSYADAMYDCSFAVHSFGYESGGFYSDGWLPAYGWWFGSGFDSFAWYFMRPPSFFSSGYASQRACGMPYRGYQRYGSYYTFASDWGTSPVGTPKLGPNKPAAPEPTRTLGFSTDSRRPGFRNGDESGPALSLTRPRFDGQRQKTNTTSSWAPPPGRTRMTVDRNDRYERSNSANTSSSGSFGATRTEGLTSRPSAPAAAPASTPAPHPAAPSPKVEAASAGKPRDP